MPPVKTFAVINQKGGVGKTTTVANLAAALAARGQRVCAMDLDPQAHLTLHLGTEPGAAPPSMYDVLAGQAGLADVCRTAGERLWLAPAVIDLAAAEIELAGIVGREQILRDQLAGSLLPFDLVLIDCPPSLGLLTLNALAAADEVLIPLQPHFLALQGLGKLLETIALVQRRINPRLRVGGVVLCMYESTTRLAGEVVRDLQGFFQAARGSATPWAHARIFTTCIRRNIKLAECPSYGMTIFDYEPASNGAADYRDLAGEFLDHVASKPAPVALTASTAQAAPAATQSSAPPGQPPARAAGQNNPPRDHSLQQQAIQPTAHAQYAQAAGQGPAEVPDHHQTDAHQP